MPDNEAEKFTETFTTQIEPIIFALGAGIAHAQRELDHHAIETQREYDEDPFYAEYGFQATFYQIPRADLELSVAIALEESGTESGTEPRGSSQPGQIYASDVLKAYGLRGIHVQPVNASYINRFNSNSQLSSKISLSIVPVPPRVTNVATTPQDVVIQAAMQDDYLVKETGTGKLPDGYRLAVNFNAQSRVWFVLEYRMENNEIHRVALVVVDDVTGKVIKSVKDQP